MTVRIASILLMAGLCLPASGGNEIDLEGVYLHLTYTMGVGGAVYPTHKAHVFLKDGSVTNDLGYFPGSSADVAEWRRRKPRAWGRWSKSGDTISIRWDDARKKPETWTKWFVARAGAGDFRLDGRYQSMGGGGNTALGGDTMTVAWNGYEFRPDGGMTTGGGAAVSSGGSGTGVSVVGSSRRGPRSGRYRIDGYAIEFEFEGGETSRAWFYLYPDSDRVIGIGEGIYTMKKK